MDWIRNYDKNWLPDDISAGLTVGVMLIPQGMAYGMLAGLPPIYGLYASTIPLILYAVFGTSRHLSVGPVAMISLLTAAGIGRFSPSTPEEYFLLAATLALLTGIITFAMGTFRLGFLVNFLSHPVISGFTSAAAIIIGLSQLKYLLGIELPRSEYAQVILLEALNNIGQTNPITLSIGIFAIGIIVFFKRIPTKIPGALVAVVMSILLVFGLGLDKKGVEILGTIPSGVPELVLPSLDVGLWKQLLPTVITISLVGFMESYAVAKVVQSKHKNYILNSDKELRALGIANIGAAFFQGYPVTGSFSRTAVNNEAGAKSGMASFVAGLLIILTLLVLTPLFFYLPKAVLAAVVFVAVSGLVDFRSANELWKYDRSDFTLLVVTFLVTLTLGITNGIVVGVLLSLGVVLYRTTRPHVAVLAKVPNEDFYRNVDRFAELQPREDILIVRFDGPLFYANINYFQDTMKRLMEKRGDKLRLIVLNADSITHIDSSAGHMLQDWLDSMHNSGIEVYFTSVIEPLRDAFIKWKLVDRVGQQHFFKSNQAAVDFFDG